jgi:hypothetical protein
MSGLLRAILFLYNLIILALGAILAAAALGLISLTAYWEGLFAAVQNRLILGSAGIIIVVLALVVFVAFFKPAPREDAIIIENVLAGQIAMTEAAAKVIIQKAVQKVEGVKETKTYIENHPQAWLFAQEKNRIGTSSYMSSYYSPNFGYNKVLAAKLFGYHIFDLQGSLIIIGMGYADKLFTQVVTPLSHNFQQSLFGLFKPLNFLYRVDLAFFDFSYNLYT